METLQTENQLIGELKAPATTKKPTNRPAMQIYRPPGLRSDGSSSTTAVTTTSSTKPKPAAGQKLSSSECDTNVNSQILKEDNFQKIIIRKIAASRRVHVPARALPTMSRLMIGTRTEV
ncbi:MIF4G domain-containing protein [Caenorhabditis elegans]|uniref:MIF4G domain-containing protein n=1 Tax=Caenorhabditis elegans TaxID=6239 RepID=H2L032_CAEEL|nr:MIF4G domain-containing protein [Caenorhabditis elegans]CCD71190.1 MIF4G domain-containing protein [Caenorhabditis elegans]|eukprot:NP_741588.2 Uncharacterized protein CELE_F44A2.5 [Caenorhabditis elegans]